MTAVDSLAHPDDSIQLLPLALRKHARERGDQTAIAFFSGRGEFDQSYSFAELDVRARAIAAALQRKMQPGARVILLFKPSLGFLAAFMGCQYAAMVAVPLQPPAGLPIRASDKARDRIRRRLERFAVIAESSEAEAVLTTSSLAKQMIAIGELAPALASAHWISIEDADDRLADSWRQPAWDPEGLSLLQYTSGSTANPKGVAVAHKHLISNANAIQELAQLDASRDACASWLPPTHDMGLIGSLLQQVMVGTSQAHISPMTFLKRPLLWLKLISKSRATITAAPNFAFDLCVHRSTPETRSGLDLSSLRVVVVGAEPIRQATMDRFVKAFEPCGFNADALYPCYGLAESTLIVTGRQGLRSVNFDREALRYGEAVETNNEADPVLMSCGRALGDTDVQIVDPDSLEPCPDGTVGEIWVASSHVGGGYFGQPEVSRETFDARLLTAPGVSFLRTGDAGVVHNGEVFITGRYKDVMVFGGANHHPHDLELTAANADAALRPDRIVAFSVDANPSERLVIGVDLRGVSRDHWSQVASELRKAILAQHGLAVHQVVALAPGALSKTPSGKPQRYLVRRRFEDGELGEII